MKAGVQIQWNITENVKGVEDRPMPYSRTGAQYRPAKVSIRFTLEKLDRPSLDRLTLKVLNSGSELPDIRIDRVIITGAKVKKDGTASLVEVTETMYNKDAIPPWARDMVGMYLDVLMGIRL